MVFPMMATSSPNSLRRILDGLDDTARILMSQEVGRDPDILHILPKWLNASLR